MTAIPGMAFVEQLPPEANRISSLLWICNAGHSGMTKAGMPIVCPACCHGENPKGSMECQRCGASGLDPAPIRGPVFAAEMGA